MISFWKNETYAQIFRWLFAYRFEAKLKNAYIEISEKWFQNRWLSIFNRRAFYRKVEGRKNGARSLDRPQGFTTFTDCAWIGKLVKPANFYGMGLPEI